MVINDFVRQDPAKITSPAELALKKTIEDIVRNIFYTEPSIPPIAEPFLAKMNNIIIEKSEPGAYFDCIGTGAFKECYDSGIPDWIIKFCSRANQTAAEEQLIKLARNFGVNDLFLLTYFVSLPFILTATDLEPYSDYWRYNNYYHTFEVYKYGECQILDAFEIQPRVEVAKHTRYNTIDFAKYEENPVKYHSGEAVSYHSLMRAGIKNRTWIEKAIDYHGDYLIKKLFTFLGEYHISDLHSGNLGYLTASRIPVIIDWLSPAILRDTLHEKS